MRDTATVARMRWLDPLPEGSAYPHLAHVGIARICFRVKDARAAYEEMLLVGAEPFTEPTLIELGGTRQRFFCARDPDGTVVEFMEFLND